MSGVSFRSWDTLDYRTYFCKVEQLVHGQTREVVPIEDEHNCQVEPLISNKNKDTV